MTSRPDAPTVSSVDAAPCDCCGAVDWQPLFAENGQQLLHCRQCDLLSLAELPRVGSRMTEMEDGHYAGNKKVLDAARQLESERVLADQFREYVSLAKQHVPDGRWLDIGCGAGLLLIVAAEAGYDGEGIELTADRRAAAQESTGRPIHGKPVEELGFPDNSFDVLSLINVFSHLVSPTETFRELHRILRPGGVLILATGEMTAGIQKSHHHNWNLGDHLHFLGDRTMARYADKVGFDVARHDRSWLPDKLWTREWLQMKGRSPAKNAVKTAIMRTPGAFPVFRATMLRRQRDSAAHSSVFALVRRPSD